MRLLYPLAAAAVLTLSVPAFAQETPAPAPVPAEEAQSPEEAALEAKGEAFEARMDQMGSELDAIMSDEAKDGAAKTAETNAVLDRYAPEITAFGDAVEAFIKAEAEKPENADKKDELIAGATQAGQAIRTIPDQVRAGIQQGIAAQAAATAAPAQPQ